MSIVRGSIHVDREVPSASKGAVAVITLLPAGGVPVAQGGGARAGFPSCGVRPPRPQFLPCRTAGWCAAGLVPPELTLLRRVHIMPLFLHLCFACRCVCRRSPKGF